MLSESQIEQAKSYLVEYIKCNENIKIAQDRIDNPFINSEAKKQWEKELTNFEQRKLKIEVTMQKEFSVDLQRIGTVEKGITITPLHILHEIKNQAKEQELIPPSKTQDTTDRPRETEKQPLAHQGSFKTEQDRHHLQDKKPSEIEQTPQAPDRTITVTHHIAEPQQHRQVEFGDRYKNHVPKQQLPVREKGKEK